MKKMRLQDYLNEWGEDLPTYGSVVTKVVEKKDSLSIQVMDWQTFICDPVDFDSAPKIEKLTLTPAQLRMKASEGWNEDSTRFIEALRSNSETGISRPQADDRNIREVN
jgi:hypothetical protein